MKNQKSKLPSEILKEASGINEMYDSLLSAGVSLIPRIGPVMYEILFQLPNKIQQKRINNTVQILQEKLKHIEKIKADKSYLESEDFYDFVMDFWKSSMRIRSEEIRKTLANIFVDSIINNESYELSVNRLFMNYLVNLSPIQIILLSFIESSESILNKIKTYDNFFAKYNLYDRKIIIDQSEFKYYSLDLENKGMISTNGGLIDFGVEDSILFDHTYVEPSVTITDLGKKFIDYIKK